jgi:uncharacterized protein (DUF58 family)
MSIILLLLIFFAFYLLQLIVIDKYWYKKLEVELYFKDREIFEGESSEIIEEIKNNKLLPVWWLGLQMSIPRFIVFHMEEEFKPRAKELRRKDFFTLLSYEKLRKNLRITVFRRGYYKIDEAVISSGDLFNIHKFMLNKSFDTYLTVYPRLIASPELKVLLNKLTGDIITKRHIIDDPFTFRGIRDYTINDSLKFINWKATAKGGEMKVNQFDYTASQEVLILLNTESFNGWGSDLMIEESIRLAASIAAKFIDKGVPVGMVVNSLDAFSSGEIAIQPKNGKANLLAILETLARLDSMKLTRKMKDIIEEETVRIRKAHSIVLISYYYDEELLEGFNLSASAGTNINWILPKLRGDKVDLEQSDNIYIWEVSEDERGIF